VIGRSPTTGLGRIFMPPASTDVEDELRQAFADDSREQGIVVASADTFLDFSAAVPEPKRPLDLVRFRFQRELYSAEGEIAALISVMKAAQIGVSAWLIRWALRAADRGATVLYVMPRERQATEFSTLRVGTVIQTSDYLRSRQDLRRTAKSDTKRLKSIGDGFLAVRGSKSEDELVSVDADALALDELDRLVQSNLPRVMQRVTGPLAWNVVRQVSTPTIPNYGIALAFADSDQRRWHVRCGGLKPTGLAEGGCGAWHMIAGGETFATLLDHKAAVLNRAGQQTDGPPIVLRCTHCRRELDVREGEWVAAHPDGQRPIGYHASKFVVPGANLAGVVHRSRATKDKAKRAFHNEDLGEPWQAVNAGLTDEQILAAVRSYRMVTGYSGSNPVTMGVDVAFSRGLNVRISEHLSDHEKRALWIGVIDDGIAPWGKTTGSVHQVLTQIMERFRVRMAVIDYMPDPRLQRGWCELHYGRAYRVGWSDNQRAVLTRPDARGDPTKLSARYYEGMDATLDLIRRQANLLPEDRPDDYDAHLKGRVLLEVEAEEDESAAPSRQGGARVGQLVQRWIKVDDDDYLQAEAFDVIASHMMFVHEAGGQIAAQDGTIVAARSSDMDMTDDSFRGRDGLDWSPGPSDEPLGGW
jgi:hypothetical protein